MGISLLEVTDYVSPFIRSRNSKVRRSQTRERQRKDVSAEKVKETCASSNQVNIVPYFQISGDPCGFFFLWRTNDSHN